MLVSVHRSVALEMSKAGPGPAPAVEETGAGARSSLHSEAKPSAQGYRSRPLIWQIQTVSFVGPARIQRVLQIKDPRLLSFVRTLHEGDVTYRLGVAARVVPASG